MVKHRVTIEPDVVDLARAKRASSAAKKPDGVVRVGTAAEVYVKGNGSVVIRGTRVKASHRLGTKAKSMLACKGKGKTEFAACLSAAGITPPYSLTHERKPR